MGEDELAEAESDLSQAYNVMTRILGESHPDVAAALVDLGHVCAVSGRDEEALDYYRRGLAIDTDTIGQVFVVASEAQRAAFIDGLRWKYDLFLSFTLAHKDSLPACVPSALRASSTA